MARRSILIILLATAISFCRAQVKLQPMEELRDALTKTTTDSVKANLLLDLALSYVYRPGEYANDLDSSILLISEAEKINEQLHDKKIEARAYFVYSNALREKGNPQALALLYNRYRIKQRLNRQLQVKQKEINGKNIELENLVSDKDELIVEKDELLEQKEWLVKEIHHRVKNNLQMIISLLNAQSEFLNHPSAIDAIRESRERMQAIAILHQKLYQQSNATHIDIRSYINEVVESIKNGIVNAERISFQTDVADIWLDVSQSLPLGLILNEAITNSVKYAYPRDEKGNVYISVQYIALQQLQLRVADKGKGLPVDFDSDHSNTLGLQLIKLFSEQLDGDLYFINTNGLEIILDFKTASYNDAVIKKSPHNMLSTQYER